MFLFFHYLHRVLISRLKCCLISQLYVNWKRQQQLVKLWCSWTVYCFYSADDADGYSSIDDDVTSKPPSRAQTFQIRERPPAPLPDTRRRSSCTFLPPDLPQKPLPSVPNYSQKPLPPPPGQEKPQLGRRPIDPKPATLPRPPLTPRQSSPAIMGKFPGRSSDSSGLTAQGYEDVINQLQKAKVNPSDKRGNIFILRWKNKADWKLDSSLLTRASRNYEITSIGTVF